MKQIVLTCLAALCCTFVAHALENPGFETGNANGWYTPQAGVPGVVMHATYPHPNNGTLGTYFAYYSPGDFATTWCGQRTGTNLVASSKYRMIAWMSNGGSANGFLDIGYCSTPGDVSTFVSLSKLQYAIAEAWAPYTNEYEATAGVAGNELCVRFPPHTGNTGGVWLDQVSVEVVPEPMVAVIGALGVLALLRRR